MRKRAENVDQTRQQIIEATVHLHGTVGPANTTIAGIAEQAGVTRLTVYRHFPEDEQLFAACTAHWLAQQQSPDPSAWAELDDPEERLRAGLFDLYRFYREGEPMLTNSHRDFAVMPEPLQQSIQDTDAHHRDVLLQPFLAARASLGTPGTDDDRLLAAAIGHAASFSAWRSLCVEQGLSNDDAIEVMARLVLALAHDHACDHEGN
jgi:AcrR family transcriptional regulator